MVESRLTSSRVVAAEMIDQVNSSYTQPAWHAWRRQAHMIMQALPDLLSFALVISPAALGSNTSQSHALSLRTQETEPSLIACGLPC